MDDTTLRSQISLAVDELVATPDEDLDRAVPGCPGWDVARLLDHLGRVHRWVTGRLTTPPDEEAPAPPRRGEEVDPRAWVADGGAALLDALAAADPDAAVATFDGLGSPRFWLRRQAHETSVHAWDARSARGLAHLGVDPELAVDGIDEVFELFVPRGFDTTAFEPTGETLHLHATDIDGEWLVRFLADGPVEVTHEHAKGDAAVRGTASDLLLALWGRPVPGELEVFGDAEILSRYQAAASF